MTCLNVSDLPQPHTSSDGRMILCVPDWGNIQVILSTCVVGLWEGGTSSSVRWSYSFRRQSAGLATQRCNIPQSLHHSSACPEPSRALQGLVFKLKQYKQNKISYIVDVKMKLLIFPTIYVGYVYHCPSLETYLIIMLWGD